MDFNIEEEREKIKSEPMKYVEDLIAEVKQGSFERMQFVISSQLNIPHSVESVECIEKILENSELSEETKLLLFNLISKEEILKYLKTKPTEELAVVIGKKLSKKDINELVLEIDDDIYISRFLISFNEIDVTIIDDVLKHIKDIYLRGKVFEKNEGISPGKEECLQQIEQYEKIKSEFLKLETEDEKVRFLINLKSDTENYESINEFNKIKKSLLQYIKEQNNRKAVIESMESIIEENLIEYVDVAQKMILEYFSSQTELTQEMQEKIEMLFRSCSVKTADLSEEIITRGNNAGEKGGVHGLYRLANNIIEINSSLRERDILTTLLHECGHALVAFSLRDEPWNYMRRNSEKGFDLEEGIVEVFAHQVFNYYFEKHESLTINSEEINKEEIGHSYEEFCVIIQTLLAPLAKDKKDVNAFGVYLFGNPDEFYKTINVEWLLSNLNENINLSREQKERLYEETIKRINKIDIDSAYFKENDILQDFYKIYQVAGNDLEQAYKFLDLIESIENCYRENDEELMVTDMNNLMGNRSLYNISVGEFDVALNKFASLSPFHTKQYFKKNYLTLSDDEIMENSTDIMKKIIIYCTNSKVCNIGEFTPLNYKEKTEKLFESENEKTIQDENDLKSQIELYRILFKRKDGLEKIKSDIPQFEGFLEQTMEKIKLGLEKLELGSADFKKYTSEELKEIPELREILETYGLVDNSLEDETFNAFVEATEVSGISLNEAVEAEQSIQACLAKTEKDFSE